MTAKRALYGLSVCLLILAASACSTPGLNAGTLPTPPAQPTAAATKPVSGAVYTGDLVEPPVLLQDFTMPSQTGAPLSLSDLNGRWRVMFFGYLHCPDFCPITLSEYRRVKRLLGEAAEQVDFIYISVDGARDTPQAISAYLDNFDPAFIGLSGDDATLARIQPDYGFYYQRRLDSGSQAVYVIDHSTRSYLVDPTGRLVASFTYTIEPEAIAEAIRWHMAMAA